MKNLANLKLNNQPYKSYGGYGVDVASKRADDLDRKMLAHLRNKEVSKVLDLGCGAGGQSFRMVLAGASVTAVDVYDFSEEFADYKLRNNISDKTLRFIKGDITDLLDLFSGEKFTDVSVQRTLHYLSYKQALKLLTSLHEVVADKLFVSVTGITSAVGENYAGVAFPPESRFEKLNTETANTFHIHEPVCLYGEEELISLLEDTGWKVEESWVSAFGNIKAVCVHSL